VALRVYGLDGRRVAEVPLGVQRSGVQSIRWNGRDERGALLAPGLYLVSVAVQSERSGELKIGPVGIVY
jgi:flagellar hook assembly protein FlgD